MDLAMPGIDGWATIRRLRAAGVRAPLAVVSANAFDRRLHNDVGIGADDFLVKPVRMEELLDWLGDRLGLQWRVAETPSASAPDAAAAVSQPPPDRLRALRHAVGLGHVRGIGRELDAIEAADPAHAPFAARLRLLARQYRFDAMNDLLEGPGDEPRAA